MHVGLATPIDFALPFHLWVAADLSSEEGGNIMIGKLGDGTHYQALEVILRLRQVGEVICGRHLGR